MRQIHEGTAAQRIVELLGPPDDLRTRNDPGGITTFGVKEVWRYGTSSHLSAATLGEVYMGEDGCARRVFGGSGEVPSEGLFEEAEIRDLLAAIDEVPSYGGGWRFNPRRLIRAVNLLQPLGKERALAAIAEYLRVSSARHDSGRDGVFLLLRVLFEIPQETGYMPRMLVGASQPAEPDDPRLLPRFPLSVEGDIPLLVVAGYSLAGVPQPPEEHLEHFRRHGVLRQSCLEPTSRPLQALERFTQSSQWGYSRAEGLSVDDRGRHLLVEQILRLLETVYRLEPGPLGELWPWGHGAEATRQQILAEVEALQIRWDHSRHGYVFLDGASLSDVKPPLYRRELWELKVAGARLEIAIERESSRYMSIDVREIRRRDTPSVAKELRLRSEELPHRTVSRLRLGSGPLAPMNWSMSGLALGAGQEDLNLSSWGTSVELPQGRRVRLELEVEGRVEQGPVLTP